MKITRPLFSPYCGSAALRDPTRAGGCRDRLDELACWTRSVEWSVEEAGRQLWNAAAGLLGIVGHALQEDRLG
jgi:hypothetical protein